MHQLPELPTPVRYREEVLGALRSFGLQPGPATQPRLVYQFLRALMTFEIRDRKARRRELERFFGPQPLADYARQIESLRERYSILRRPLDRWIEGRRGPDSGAEGTAR